MMTVWITNSVFTITVGLWWKRSERYSLLSDLDDQNERIIENLVDEKR